MPTLAEEDYLKALFSLQSESEKYISTSSISSYLSINPASVTEMIKKLSAKGLVDYKRSHGATLSRKGQNLAISIVRKHRLWETFLVNKLNFSWEEVHEIAEQLEHIKSEELVEKLDEYLGFPKSDPHGDPIPDKKGNFTQQVQVLASSLKKGEVAVVAGVGNQDTNFLKHLNQQGISLGTKIKVIEINEFDGSQTIRIGKKESFLSKKVGENLFVFRT